MTRIDTASQFRVQGPVTSIAERAKGGKGEMIYGNFMPVPGPAPSVVPDAALPNVTARSLTEIMQDMEWALARSRMALSGKD